MFSDFSLGQRFSLQRSCKVSVKYRYGKRFSAITSVPNKIERQIKDSYASLMETRRKIHNLTSKGQFEN